MNGTVVNVVGLLERTQANSPTAPDALARLAADRGMGDFSWD
jgi:hypothetical protein